MFPPVIADEPQYLQLTRSHGHLRTLCRPPARSAWRHRHTPSFCWPPCRTARCRLQDAHHLSAPTPPGATARCTQPRPADRCGTGSHRSGLPCPPRQPRPFRRAPAARGVCTNRPGRTGRSASILRQPGTWQPQPSARTELPACPTSPTSGNLRARPPKSPAPALTSGRLSVHFRTQADAPQPQTPSSRHRSVTPRASGADARPGEPSRPALPPDRASISGAFGAYLPSSDAQQPSVKVSARPACQSASDRKDQGILC